MAWTVTTNLKPTLTLAVAAGGTGYAVGDVLTITQSGASGGTATVLTLTGSAVATVVCTSGGSGYFPANTLATTVAPAGGTSCTLNITAVNYIGANIKVSPEGESRYLLYVGYTKGNESTVTFAPFFLKDTSSLYTDTQYKHSPEDTATAAQFAFSLSATGNWVLPVTTNRKAIYVGFTLDSTGATPTGTLSLYGYPDTSNS